jgi:methylenetetrahydrofolate reductase (NADPH)
MKNAIQNNTFIITCELAPPKGPNTSTLVEQAKALKGLVDAINITDGQGGNMRMSSVIASYLIQKEASVETICQMVCRDRNQIGLQSDILGAYALGLKNFLALSGDKASGGDHPNAKDVFDFSTDCLIKVFSQFAQGHDFAGNKLNGNINDIMLGAAAHPGLEDLKGQATKMQRRIEEGVNFFQTQIVYEEEQLKHFLDSIENIQVPILIGIAPLKSVKMAHFMNEKVFGVNVPNSTIERLERASDATKEGIQIAFELINKVKELGGKGVHIMAINQEKLLPQILKELNEKVLCHN